MPSTKIFRAPTLVCLLAMMPASICAQKITLEFDEAQDFSGYKTFVLLRGTIHSQNPSLNNELVTKKLDALIRKRLTERGLTEVDAKPDLNVIYTLGSGRRKQVERYGAGWGGTRVVVAHFTEGTLILNLRDATKHELVWRTIAIEEKSDPMKIQAALDDMVRKSFEKYPPKGK